MQQSFYFLPSLTLDRLNGRALNDLGFLRKKRQLWIRDDSLFTVQKSILARWKGLSARFQMGLKLQLFLKPLNR